MMSPKQGRPFEKSGKKGRLEIRTSEAEESILDFCVNQTGKSRAEIIRQGIYEVYNQLREDDESASDEEFDEISEIKVNIPCPYCDANNRISVSEYEVDSNAYERGDNAMGAEIEHILEATDFQCESCRKTFTFKGEVWEYPVGAVNYKNIDCAPLDDNEEYDD